MKFHIVSSSENIKKIAFLYNMEVEEIQKENRHIRDWQNLVPGTKLKIPVLSEAVINEVNEFEPFIEDYYPKYDLNEKIDSEIYNVSNEEINMEVNNNEYVSVVENDKKEEKENKKEEVKEDFKVEDEKTKDINMKGVNSFKNDIKDINEYQRRYYMIPPYPYVNPMVYPPFIYIVRRNRY